MKHIAIAMLLSLSFSPNLFADEDVFRIEIGRDYKKYSNTDLQRRVWDLERAVWQLQRKVYNLEANNQAHQPDSWACTIEAMGDKYVGTGATKAVATAKAMKDCKAGRGGDGFFCKDVKCENE